MLSLHGRLSLSFDARSHRYAQHGVDEKYHPFLDAVEEIIARDLTDEEIDNLVKAHDGNVDGLMAIINCGLYEAATQAALKLRG